MSIPDFLVAGGHKCATTTLASYLDAHSQAAMSRVKEPHFLAREALRDRLHQGVWDQADYERLWLGSEPGQRLGEASVLYLSFADEVVRHLAKSSWGRPVKVIVSLRNPVDRAFSSYADERLKNPQETAATFEDAVAREIAHGPRSVDGSGSPAIRHLALGFYAHGIETFQRALGEENVHVLLFEDLTIHPHATWLRVEQFLGLPHEPEALSRPALNTGGVRWAPGWRTRVARAEAVVRARRYVGRRSPVLHARLRALAMRSLTEPTDAMLDTTRAQLAQLYEGEVRRLEGLLGRPLDSWKLE